MATTLISANDGSTAQADARSGKYLVFHLGAEEFAIQVQKVREIMGVQEITQVPQTPVYVKGVINLRGKVIPVVDLRLKFALPSIEYTQRTCIVVVQVEGERGPMMMGIVVDGVAEVIHVAAADVEDTPSFGADISLTYVLGLAKLKGKVRILLDIDRVMNAGELAHIGTGAV